MKTAFLKAVVGVLVAVTACAAALFVPGLLGDERATQLSTQSVLPIAAQPVLPTTAPIAPMAAADPTPPEPTAVARASEPTPTPGLAPAVRPTALPTAVVIEALDDGVASAPIPVPRVALQSANALPATSPTVAPTPAETTRDVAPSATPKPTTAATVEAKVAPTAEPTPEPTATPIPESTPEPTAQPTATVEPDLEPDGSDATVVGAGWMFVDSDTGLFLREDPAGDIVNVLEHRGQVFVSGRVIAMQGRLWMEVESPAPGWVALSFLTAEQPPAPVEPTPSGPSEPPTAADWIAFRDCEAGGRYDAVDISGLYHGAYQFLPSTWDGLARRFWPELVGVLPSQASPQDQDKMAAKLFELEGARPWPVCGRHLL